MVALLDVYLTNASMYPRSYLQYRVGGLMRAIAFLVEPVVYLVIWTAIAEQRGGEVAGMPTKVIAAYFIVWTLVRTTTAAFTPQGFEWRVQHGYFSYQLVRPLHPIHYDLSFYAGYNITALLTWLPAAALLCVVFRPELHPSGWQVAVFVLAACGAYVLRSILLWLLGMVNFWTTRTSALFELFMVSELLLAGRLVPMDFMPTQVSAVANWLPFYWTFGFPIEVLVLDRDGTTMWRGLAAQVLWIGVCATVLLLVWRRAVRRYTAVGN